MLYLRCWWIRKILLVRSGPCHTLLPESSKMDAHFDNSPLESHQHKQFEPAIPFMISFPFLTFSLLFAFLHLSKAVFLNIFLSGPFPLLKIMEILLVSIIVINIYCCKSRTIYITIFNFAHSWDDLGGGWVPWNKKHCYKESAGIGRKQVSVFCSELRKKNIPSGFPCNETKHQYCDLWKSPLIIPSSQNPREAI